MTAINAGRVELDIVALAKDQVSATLREVNRSLQGTKAQMDAVKGSGGGIGAAFSSAKEGLKPVNSIREGFENIRANVLGLPMAIGGAVTGLVALVSELQDADIAAAALKENAHQYAEAIRGVVDWVKQLRVANGAESKDQQEASDRRIKHQEDLRAATEKLLFLESEIGTVRARQAAVAESWAGLLADSKSAYLEIRGLENERLEAEREIAKLTAESAENIQRQATAALVMSGLRGFASGAGKGVETIDATIPVVGRRARGGGARAPSSDAADVARRLYESQRAEMDKLISMAEDLANASTGTSGASSGKRGGGLMGGLAGRQVKALEDNRAAVAALASEYDRLGSSLMGLAGPLGQISGGLGAMTSALGTGLSAAARFMSGDLIGGITGVLGGILGLFSDTHKKARGIARDAERDLASARGGPSTIIINVAPGSDPQAAARATRQVLYSSRGTGADTRSMAI